MIRLLLLVSIALVIGIPLLGQYLAHEGPAWLQREPHWGREDVMEWPLALALSCTIAELVACAVASLSAVYLLCEDSRLRK
jgi:hypothetical protein